MLHTYIMLMFTCTNIRKTILLVPIVSSGFDDFLGSPPGSDHTFAHFEVINIVDETNPYPMLLGIDWSIANQTI